MSMAIKVSKAQYRGDPGLFGFVGKAIGSIANIAGSVIPGPLGGVAKAVGSVLAPRPTTNRPSILVSQPIPGSVMTAGAIPPLTAMPGSGVSIGGPKGIQIGTFAAPGTSLPSPVSSGPLVGTQGAAPCTAKGYHHNKTGYFTKKYGYIEKGTICVKNRRRNPLNPRALSRAMARLESAKKATRCLARYSIREKKSCSCGGRR